MSLHRSPIFLRQGGKHELLIFSAYVCIYRIVCLFGGKIACLRTVSAYIAHFGHFTPAFPHIPSYCIYKFSGFKWSRRKFLNGLFRLCLWERIFGAYSEHIFRIFFAHILGPRAHITPPVLGPVKVIFCNNCLLCQPLLFTTLPTNAAWHALAAARLLPFHCTLSVHLPLAFFCIVPLHHTLPWIMCTEWAFLQSYPSPQLSVIVANNNGQMNLVAVVVEEGVGTFFLSKRLGTV